jgi:hypothetical protein
MFNNPNDIINKNREKLIKEKTKEEIYSERRRELNNIKKQKIEKRK